MKKVLLIPVAVFAFVGCLPAADTTTVIPGSGGGTATGGATSGSGGAPTGSGGAVSASGGEQGSGGAPSGSGGAPSGSGGATSGSGGEQGNGGASTGSGGRATGGGGSGTGTGGAGTGGAGGRAAGGMPGTGGMPAPGGAAGGAPGSLLDVARVLNGQMLLGPCKANAAASVCDTREAGASCPTNTADRALAGVLTTDRTVTLGGTAGTMYTITLHVQGVVESKQYTNGMDKNSSMQHPRADGFCTGGTPSTGDNYNVYMIRVTNPGAAKVDYFLNSLQGPGVSNHTTYGMDYTAQIKAQGGATIRLVAGDSNCQMIKNCGPMENSGNVCAAPVVLAGVDPMASSLNPTFNFGTAYNGQWIAMVVTAVTSP